ncbi:hypothetical protein [Nocardioides abyssi]|uniref:Phage tail protein n=1 Tax=Nocardioides abyssi TaxID=3058370 RepID=A0ABT8EXZ7_9ACTN|nr:hypothetical protein [Nocardioides abyssi]MDN4162944.1 hypothetical protein [Nocardioides abyssi]
MTNSNNVVAPKPMASGGILVGDLTAAAPTDATTALTGFTPLGYVGEDGLTQTTDRSTDKVKAWGGDTVKILQTDFASTFSFTLIETLNADVLETVFGAGNVTVAAGGAVSIAINGDELPQRSFVFDMKDGDNRVRLYVPKGQVTSVDDVTYTDGEVSGFSVTVEAFVDENGNNAYQYISRPAA